MQTNTTHEITTLSTNDLITIAGGAGAQTYYRAGFPTLDAYNRYQYNLNRSWRVPQVRRSRFY